MKTFKGNVRPFVEINGLKRVEFGEVISLEDWQVNSKNFQFALRNKWVVSADRTSVVLNHVPPQQPQIAPQRPIVEAQKQAVREIQKAEGISPSILTDVLDKQTLLIQGMQKSYESLQKSIQPAAPAEPAKDSSNNKDVLALLSQLIEQQKLLVEQSKQPSGVDTHLMSALLSEIRNLSPAKADTSSEVVSLLSEIKEQLANQKTQVVYNNSSGAGLPGSGSGGFKIQEVEEKFVAKVEELNVKDSKIVTQQTNTGGTDDALAALRKLKGK